MTQGQSNDPLGFEALPCEELRLALVLNGGVSLAVWMGGVAHEINRLTHARRLGAGYQAILGLTRTSAIVDVISGTSAGGINGAALALAQVNEEADLRSLRDLWSEQGRMEVLLRSPFQGTPSSLLRGDDYFLPELNRAMQILAHPFKQRSRDGHSGTADGQPHTPMDLTLTTTLLTGAQRVTIDDFGERIPQRIHDATFRFSNVEKENGDLFSAERIRATADALALASRCTASFPVAFEPSFVPVGEKREGAGSPEDRFRPSMEEYASWFEQDGGDQSRYAVDGGVLANTPVSHALKAIERRQADGPVRRSLLLVFPHAPQAEEVPADLRSEPPTATASLAKVLGALQAQGSRSYVDRLDEHNRRAAEWVGGREQLLRSFDGGSSPVQGVYDLLKVSWAHYRHIRIRLAAQGLAGRVAPAEQWPYERIRSAAETAQRAWVHEHNRLPYVPRSFNWQREQWVEEYVRRDDVWRWGDTGARGVTQAAAAVLREALGLVRDEEAGKKLTAARLRVGRAINRIADLRARIDAPWESSPLRGLEPNEAYWSARLVAYGLAMGDEKARRNRSVLKGFLDDVPVPRPDEGGRTARMLRELPERPGHIGTQVSELVHDAVAALVDVQTELQEVAGQSGGVGSLQAWCDYLFAERLSLLGPGPSPAGTSTGRRVRAWLRLRTEPADRPTRVLLRLLALDAATRLVAEGSRSGSNQPIRLGELSLRLEHPWAVFSQTPDDKAAGLEVARFGGFLKRSWRVNDWTWGRLDAATMLCQTVLDPDRLERLAVMTGRNDLARAHGSVAEAVLARLRHDLYGGALLPSRLSGLEKGAEEDLEEFFSAAFDPKSTEPKPLHLPRLARWAALPLQAEIILEELPVLTAAIELDVHDGAGTPTRGTRFLLEAKAPGGILQRIAEPPDQSADPATKRLEVACDALAAFDRAGIGREPLAEEVGSDSLIRTVSKAVGVLATVLDSDAARVNALRPVTKAVRGALMVPFWLVHGLAGGGAIARFLATMGLVVGGVLLALSLLGALGSLEAAGGLIGAAALLAALAYSSMRTGSLLHGAALLAPVGPLLAFAWLHDRTDGDGAGRVLVVLLAALTLFVIGSLPWPLRSPLATVPPRAGWVGGAVGLGLVAALSWPDSRNWLRGNVWEPVVAAWESVRDAPLWAWAADVDELDWSGLPPAFGFTVAAVVAVGAVVAYRQGVLLRVWQPEARSTLEYGRPQRVLGEFRQMKVRHPAGVAASWAPVYGGLYLAAAAVLFHLTRPGVDADGDSVLRAAWAVVSLWWLVLLGAVLCLVAPWWVTRASRRRIRVLASQAWRPTDEPAPSGPEAEATNTKEEKGQPPQGIQILPTPGDDEQQLLHLLLKYGLTYDYLVSPTPGDGTDAWVMSLDRRHGERLLRDVKADHAALAR